MTDSHKRGERTLLLANILFSRTLADWLLPHGWQI
jgi:hypothetical protein